MLQCDKEEATTDKCSCFNNNGLLKFAYTCDLPHDTHTCMQEDSQSTFPLYAEVKDIKWKHKREEGDGSEPKVPHKQLTEDLNEEIPTVPQQNLTTDDIQQMGLSTTVLLTSVVTMGMYDCETII